MEQSTGYSFEQKSWPSRRILCVASSHTFAHCLPILSSVDGCLDFLLLDGALADRTPSRDIGQPWVKTGFLTKQPDLLEPLGKHSRWDLEITHMEHMPADQ